MSQRLESLRQLVDQDPNNSRFRYMLAMELAGGGLLEESAEGFAELLTRDPTYVAAYFHSGQTFEKLGLIEDARGVYARGVEAATLAGEAHARAELEAALEMLG